MSAPDINSVSSTWRRFGPGAKACAEHLAKGRQVGVVRRVSYREWEKDGVKRSKHQVVGRVVFGGKYDEVPAAEEDGGDE